MAVQLADVLRRHGPSYIERYGASMLPSHLRAMRDLVRCRTAELGGHAAECTCCGREHLLPGGGLAPDGRTFVQPPRRKKPYLVPVDALGVRFRARFRDLARKALPDVVLPHIADDKPWVVFRKPAVQGADKVLDYLGRYVHRTALSGKAIVACDDETVTFRYRPSGQSTRRTMTLPAREFLRRFLQHVRPKGFHRVRAFGLLHPAHRSTLQQLQLLLGAPAIAEQTAEVSTKEPDNRRSRLRCRGCGQAALRLVRRLSPEQCAAWEARVEGSAVERARAPP